MNLIDCPVNVCYITDGTNMLVSVFFNQMAGTITCSFFNQEEIGNLSCTVEYGPGEDCNNLTFTSQGTSSTSNSVILPLSNSLSTVRVYCYTATASNRSHTVISMGIFYTGIACVSVHIHACVCVCVQRMEKRKRTTQYMQTKQFQHL